MVIRNPYGFFARHYKIIHLILLIPIIYLTFCFSDIAGFFHDYIRAGYSTPETSITDSYINIYQYILLFLLVLANGTIFVILASKKKNNIYYGISCLYFFVMIIFLKIFSSTMSNIEQARLVATFANFIRDLARTVYLPLYVSLIVNFVKGVGFNIKTLRFDAGSELKISEEDEEDVEINIGGDVSDTKRTIVHIINELKYYVLENKFVMKCLAVVFILILGYNIYVKIEVYNKTYAVNQAFQLSDFTLSIKDSYISDVDYMGNVIEEGKYYLAIKIGLQNNSMYGNAIDKYSFRIIIGNKILYPSFDKSSRFLDIGATYQGETIPGESGDDYVFVYELTQKEIKGSYQMRILSQLTQTYDGLKSKYKKITIRPQNIIKVQDLGTANAKKEVSFKNTILGNTTYKINSIEVADSYMYKYEKCFTADNCMEMTDFVIPRSGYKVLIIDDEINFDETTEYYANSEKDFYADFAKIKYWFKNSNKNYESSELLNNTITLTNITPNTIKDKKIYEVPNTLKGAEKIVLKIKIRNKKLEITLKD